MKQITIATYNIRHGHDVGFDWARLAEIIKQSRADIIGIQEVDMHTDRIAGRDTISGLVNATGLPYALFVPTMDFDGGQYGTAILSRYPLASAEYHALDAADFEPRAFGYVTVNTDDGTSLGFLNTHLTHESRKQQAVQFTQLSAWMGEHIDKDSITILTGDFNTENFSDFSPLLDIGFSLVNNQEHTHKTFRSPPLAIDNIVYRASRLSPAEQGMIDSDRSDHNLLWCRFDLR